MRQYKFHYLDHHGALMLTRSIYARDDVSAFAQARTLCLTHTIEVGRDERIVARFDKRSRWDWPRYQKRRVAILSPD